MKKDQIRKLAKERIDWGYTRQMVHDELVMLHPEEKPKRIADVVRYMASQMAREQYRGHQIVLLLAMLLSAAIEVGRPILADGFHGGMFRGLSLVPFGTLFLGHAVFRWRGEVFKWLAILNVLGAMGLIGMISKSGSMDVDPWAFAGDALQLLIGLLAWHLASRVFGDHDAITDPIGLAPPRYVFPPEPGAVNM